MLSAENIVVEAGQARLLDGVSLSVARGETVVVVGPNGAGKSTLLRVLSGALRPRSGQVRLAQRSVFDFAPHEVAQRRAVLSQNVAVAFPFTVAEIVAMGAGRQPAARVGTQVMAALAECGLEALSERVFSTLSGGEQQRAHFARVLVQMAYGEALHGPGLLLLDEPTSSLDLKHQLALMDAARRCAARGVAVLAILHDLNLAARFADRIIVLAQGHIDSQGTPETVIGDDLLARVFGVSGAVNRTPANLPFVLLHEARIT